MKKVTEAVEDMELRETVTPMTWFVLRVKLVLARTRTLEAPEVTDVTGEPLSVQVKEV